MMKLVTFPPSFGLRNVSPFCLKVEMLLASLGLEFEIEEQSDPRKAPKGKLPVLVASRWLDDAWWPNVVEGFFGFVPRLVRPLAAGAARRQVAKTYQLHGLGRHTLEEQRGFARRDLAALEAGVSDGGFLTGAEPNVHDFAVAALLAGIYDQQPGSWLTPIAREHAKLHEYTERVQARVGVWARPAP